ncbi:sugar phosphate isomerase/epimerase family protein [Streptomyces boninensis]|uniref:sugar phosphate isomerase/epimerase family protein n=1 Tax=Streptomyces boninensis TaxID=2039455 RepID=UPI003B214545
MNRRAFSTLGCPELDLAGVVRLASADGRCAGVELRCADGQMIAPDKSAAEADAIAARLGAADLAVVCLASYVQVASPASGVVAELERHLRLAARLGASYVRVFGGIGSPERAVRNLAASVPAAEAAGVGIVLETHDEFLTGAAVADVLAAVGSPAVGAVWDAVNPWRAGEPVAETAAALGPWLRHVQFKDVASAADLRPVLPGAGVLPLQDIRAALDRIGYAGWISLEWERAWYPEAAPLAEALGRFHRVLDA